MHIGQKIRQLRKVNELTLYLDIIILNECAIIITRYLYGKRKKL